jgi:hypothetical protein
MINDSEQKIARPRQIYTGPRSRLVVPLAEREQNSGTMNQPVAL